MAAVHARSSPSPEAREKGGDMPLVGAFHALDACVLVGLLRLALVGCLDLSGAGMSGWCSLLQ